jgi:hypothetical protein
LCLLFGCAPETYFKIHNAMPHGQISSPAPMPMPRSPKAI